MASFTCFYCFKWYGHIMSDGCLVSTKWNFNVVYLALVVITSCFSELNSSRPSDDIWPCETGPTPVQMWLVTWQHKFRLWLVAWRAQRQNFNQSWLVCQINVYIFQQNLFQNPNFHSIKWVQNVNCKILAIVFNLQSSIHSHHRCNTYRSNSQFGNYLLGLHE